MDIDSLDLDTFTTTATRNSARQLGADEQSERSARIDAMNRRSHFADPWSGNFPMRREPRGNSRRLTGGPNRF